MIRSNRQACQKFRYPYRSFAKRNPRAGITAHAMPTNTDTIIVVVGKLSAWKEVPVTIFPRIVTGRLSLKSNKGNMSFTVVKSEMKRS